MEALKLSFPQTLSFSAKTAVAPVQNQALFASLMGSLSTQAELPVEEQAPTSELAESLENLLMLLEELPADGQIPEQQELQYAILQLQDLQTKNQELNSTAPNSRSGTEQPMAEAAGKLLVLLERIQQKLQVLSDKFAAEFAVPPFLRGAEEKKSSTGSNGLAQLSKKLDELIGILEKGQQEVLASQQGKSIGQEPMKVLPVDGPKLNNSVSKSSTETIKPAEDLPKIPVEIQQALQKAEVKDPQAAVKHQNIEELQTTKAPNESKAPQEPAVQPPATVATEAGKTAGNQIRTEASPPAAPFVRLSNLLEDLGGMLKSSMRMAETAEGMKMRVNIFPEHLGHLEILLTSTNGKLAAQIMASTPMAKEALELQLNQLRASLVQQGVTVEKIEVLQQSSQQPSSQQHSQTEQRFAQPQQKNGTAAHNKNGYTQQEEEKLAERQPSVGQLMKVDYTV